MSDVPITELEACRTCGSDARDAFGVKGWCYFGQDKPFYFDTRPCPDAFHVTPKCRTCGGAKGTPGCNFLDESCPDPFHAEGTP